MNRFAAVTASALALVSCASIGLADTRPAEAVSFLDEVMPVFTRAGCNAGGCHGAPSGKDGFHLSLWGEKPDQDYLALTREQMGRRTDRLDPDQSLILRKATASIPHEGGQRFTRDSHEYRILRDWIAQGMPRDPEDRPRLLELRVEPAEYVAVGIDEPVQLRATARFADGSERDVTHLAGFEPADPLVEVDGEGRVHAQQVGHTAVLVRYQDRQEPVRVAFVPDLGDFEWADPPAFNGIDEHVHAQLRKLRMNPSDLSDDPSFVRRVFLDVLGVLPTAEEARAFVQDPAPDKRQRLVDRLLERPEFADRWALMWADLLRVEENVLDTKGVQHFHAWIRANVEWNTPLDQFVRELVTARGSTYREPATNFYRALRQPNARAEGVAQLFLGTRLSCAQCHRHPFEDITQGDYYGFAALFARVDYRILENTRRDRFDQNQFRGEQIVWHTRDGEVRDPRTGEPAEPRFLGDGTAGLAPDQDRLAALADWLTAPENRRFARVMANRVWANLLGRGIVDPPDDFAASNLPAIPGLLDELADDLIANGYDLRRLVRRIVLSRTYQVASEPNATNAHDEHHFARALVRRLSAEQLIDGVSQVLDAPARFNGYPVGTRAGQIPGVQKVFRDRNPGAGDRFLELFGKPPRLLTSDCERTAETALGQVFELVSGDAINVLLVEEDNRIGRILQADLSDREAIGKLYWTALSRPPSREEAEALEAYLREAPVRREALEDIAWALLNAKAFVLRH